MVRATSNTAKVEYGSEQIRLPQTERKLIHLATGAMIVEYALMPFVSRGTFKQDAVNSQLLLTPCY